MQDVLSIPSVAGIDLNLRIAGPGARSYAFIIDWHIRTLAAFGWFMVGVLVVYGSFQSFDPTGLNPVFTFGVILPAVAIYFLYHPVLEILMTGRTPGKRIAGVRIVKPDGGTPGVGPLLVRNVFRLIDSLPSAYGVGLVTTILTERSVRFGDMAAGTLLIYDDTVPAGIQVPVDVAAGGLGLERQELVRDLLDRWDGLAAATRTALAKRLLANIGRDTDTDDPQALRSELEQLVATGR